MIKLIIDGHEAVLDGESFSAIRENPFFSRTGDYTLDINLSLSVPANRKLYVDVYRLHFKTDVESKDALLMYNEKVLLRGKAVLLAVEDGTAKIQLLSNNSELNYICDNDTRIRDMDFGTCVTRNTTDAVKVSGALYGSTVDGIEVREAYPQIFKDDFTDFGTEANMFNEAAGGGDSTGIAFTSDDNLRPQPYLLYYVDKLIELLGYTLGDCDIDRVKYKRLILINGHNTNYYAKMLPDWTVSEFITEIEKFFNVVFFVNSSDMTVDILSVDRFYDDAGTYYISKDKVIDTKEIEFGEAKESLQTSYQNVGYKLPTGEYWKYASLDENIYSVADKSNLSTAYYNNPYDPSNYEVFKDTDKDVEWVHYGDEDGSDDSKYGRLVNQFAPVVSDAHAERTELKIIPAKMLCSYRVGNHGSYTFAAPIPTYYEDNGSTFNNAIRNGASDNAGDVLQVAFFIGWVPYRNQSSYGALATMTTRWLELRNSKWEFTSSDCSDIDLSMTLSLNGQHGRCATELTNSVGIDTTKLFKFKFLYEGWLDARSKFVIDNRLFYCKKLEYEFVDGSMARLVKGEFYPATESSEESESESGSEVVTGDATTHYNSISADEGTGVVWMYDPALSGALFLELTGLTNNVVRQDIVNATSNWGLVRLGARINEINHNSAGTREVIAYKNGVLVSDETYTGDTYTADSTQNFCINPNLNHSEIVVGDEWDYILVVENSNGDKYKGRVRFTIV